MIQVILDFLQQHIGTHPPIVGLSGGIDSTTVAWLLRRALPDQNIVGLIMPAKLTAPVDIADAQRVAKHLDIECQLIPIEPILEACTTVSQDFTHQHAALNLPARVRMTLLYGKANSCNGLVVGTGNRTELFTGYFTKYGDGGVDLLPLGHLYKTEIWQLARDLGVFPDIITKVPTAGLRAGQTDEAELGLPYTTLDAILQALEAGNDLTEFSNSDVERVQYLRKQAQHKLHLPLILPRS